MLVDYSRELRWSYIGSFALGVLQIASTSIMARLLTPADFGIMAVVLVLSRALGYFAQLGVARALVQKETIDEEEIRGAWTVALTCGLLSTLAMFGGASWFARFFHQEAATAAIRLFSFNFLLQAVALTPAALLRRRLHIKRLAGIETLAFVIGQFALGVPAACLGAGYRAIVLSMLGQSLVLAVVSFAAASHSLRPSFSFRRYSSLIFFGGKASGVSVIEYLSASADTFTLGKVASATSLGLYNRAFLLINLPLQYLSDGLKKVLFPALAREQNDAVRLRQLIVDATRTFSAVVIPVGIGAAFSARPIVLTVLGEKWSDAVPVFQWLCLAAVFNCLSHISALSTEAVGKFCGKAWAQSAVAVTMLVAVYEASKYGIAAAGIAVAVVEAFRCILLLLISTRLLKCSPLRIVRTWAPGLGGAVAVGLTAALIDRATMLPTSPLIRLVLAIMSCTVVLFAYYRVFYAQAVLLPMSALVASGRREYPAAA
ncbi:MAG TPA: lipopolysaccharide biosynthesis protein [Terriglobales bacterium]|nr:lipopolysaccharide biosynthesis protein [Terriglobales bacterium]